MSKPQNPKTPKPREAWKFKLEIGKKNEHTRKLNRDGRRHRQCDRVGVEQRTHREHRSGSLLPSKRVLANYYLVHVGQE